MKNLRKIVCFILCICIVFSITACKVDDVKPAPEPVDTEIDLIKGSVSDYSVVISENANDMEIYAAEEFTKYFNMATGCLLPIKKDNEIEVSLKGKFLSIGKNKLLSESKIVADIVELNTNGFKIETKDNSIIMIGGDDEGTVYSAYELLKIYFNFEVYAREEIVFNKLTDAKLKNISIKEIPSIATRTVYQKSLNTFLDARLMMRTHTNETWGVFGHSYFNLVNPSIYFETNPDWYYPNKKIDEVKQLCLTAPGLVETLTANLQKEILSKADSDYFMIGQEDTNLACQCANCLVSHKKYGNASGTMMVFTNKVARAIKEWQKTACPDRQIYLATFAYQKTRPAPAKFNNETKKFEPFHADVVAEDNLLIQYAPLEACYAHTLYDDCNSTFGSGIDGWKSVSKHFAIWTYSTNFTNYLLHFNNFSTIKDNYQIFKDMGAQLIMDQGTGETVASPFHDLRAYVQSKLMWNVDLDVNKLIDDFLKNYYKDVYNQMKEYFNLLRVHFMSLDTDLETGSKGKFHSHVYNMYGFDNERSIYWPKAFVDKCANILDEAKAIVNAMPASETKEKLKIRVLSETFPIRYLNMQFYSSYFSSEEFSKQIDEFESDAELCNLVCWKETTPLGSKLNEWRNSIK